MTQQSNFTATKPSHRLYLVSGSGPDANWREIGAAWPNKDGNGFSINCVAVPLGGRIVMRKAKEATKAAA